MIKKIRDLPANPACSAVYKRNNGDLYIRLNDEYHVKGKPGKTENEWIGDGTAEEIDPDEEVEVVFDRTA